MRPLILFLICTFLCSSLMAQNDPELRFRKDTKEKQLRYLASDELMGRRTGAPGNDTAAAFIARHFAQLGLETVPGADGYYQKVYLEEVAAPMEAQFTFGDQTFRQKDNLMVLRGAPAAVDAPVVFAGHGMVMADKNWDDYANLDVRGKVVVVMPGTEEAMDPQTIFEAMPLKIQWAEERGAVALFELYRISFPWGFFTSYFGRPSMQLAQKNPAMSNNLTYGWIKEEDLSIMNQVRAGTLNMRAQGTHSGGSRVPVKSQNVIGMVRGTDPTLMDEYIIVSAHYDHVGTGKQGGGFFTEEDSIFNGARDNAMGTVALMASAKALTEEPAKRSVVFLALTGEELGLLGSRYYVDNPLIPLHKTIFNLNTDGAGYNDTSIVSAIGYGRTGIDEELDASAQAFGLEVFPNPAPEQNLFDRSDNVSFAAKGVPAVNLSPGIRNFDQDIMLYYHQVRDEADTIDFDYLLKYCQILSMNVRKIANKENRPFWVPGDKYEAVGKELYGK